jgi:uncharacterized protein YdhG (YjbR/CyaY superfamily)
VADVERYLEGLPSDRQAALRDLRATIEGVVPDASLAISYGIPTFKLRGHPLVGFGAAKSHCTFFVMSTEAMRAQADRLEGYATGKGSVRFTSDTPLPDDLVIALVRTRIAEVDARWPA